MTQRPIPVAVPASRVFLSKPGTAAFTLIELSIVLVIIGLIVGGVLVGQSLINAAAVRAQISQIEKFQTAARTFYGKYGYLPGDIKDPDASSFGFVARGTFPGMGDGNGVIEGVWGNAAGRTGGYYETDGETQWFWLDLGTANLIDVTVGNPGVNPPPGLLATPLYKYFPTAKIGQSNYLYVWSQNGINYFGLSAIIDPVSMNNFTSNTSLTVAQAYAIDSKTDDGLPQTGNVTAQYINQAIGIIVWAGSTAGSTPWTTQGAAPGTASAGASTTCYDNGGNAANPMQYSIAQNGGANPNCALSFRFQ